jgi:hypothetical protein
MSRLVNRLTKETHENIPFLLKWINKNKKHQYGFVIFVFSLIIISIIVNLA